VSALRLRYQTIEFGSTDIHIKTLRDRQQFSDPLGIAKNLGISSANWSLFGIVWASGEILAKLMFQFDIEGKRILEVGCGIGLASLVLNKRSANITATDYHPEVEKFLKDNAKLNNTQTIPFTRTAWTDENVSLGTFDIIIGSDLLYEEQHARELSHFIEEHAKPNCEIIIVDPGRKYHARFTKMMQALGYVYHANKYKNLAELTQPIRGCNTFQTLFYAR